MTRAWLLLWMLTACATRTVRGVDETLPDPSLQQATSPESALSSGATDGDPSVRAHALSQLVRVVPAENLTRWAMQGMYDPDPFVQRLVVETLWERRDAPGGPELLAGYVNRGSADPYVRCWLGRQMVGAGMASRIAGVVGAWQGKPGWRAAPLALLGWTLGEEEALPVLASALARGSVMDDVDFLTAAARLDEPSVADAMVDAQPYLEESTATMYAFARAVSGRPGGMRDWASRLRDTDEEVNREAVEHVTVLSGAERQLLARRAKRARDGVAREAAALMARPSRVALLKALTSGDVFVRQVAAGQLEGVEESLRVELLRYALVDDDSDVRLVAARAAAQLKAPELRPYLEALAVDDRAAVRMVAAGALYDLSH